MAAVLSWSRETKELSTGKSAVPTIKNHTATLIGNELFVFGGYDGNKNHNEVHILDCDTLSWRQAHTKGPLPAARNGHTATLAKGKIFIIGGWLGSGPLAAQDCHILHVDALMWETDSEWAPPGPCNMHTADYIESLERLFIFRGGDGSEYLNHLHALDVNTMRWSTPSVQGTPPLPRANHSSAVIDEKIFIFGGWDGRHRLNDIHILDAASMVWSRPGIAGNPPTPRAGMTFTRVRNRIICFGGSGQSAQCFNDLHVLDVENLKWLTIREHEDAENAEMYERKYADDGEQVELNDDGNPNSLSVSDYEGSVVVTGMPPGRRAGHSTSVIDDRRLFVFGGSFGTDYLNDFFVLDTIALPVVRVTLAPGFESVGGPLRDYCNCERFSDVEFLVEGRKIYAHRIVLSVLSDRFRALFTSGFRESNQKCIEIADTRYKPFMAMLEYLYSGVAPEALAAGSSEEKDKLEIVGDLLQLSDLYMLDHLKQLCEVKLKSYLDPENVEALLSHADMCNAAQLSNYCRHYQRRQDFFKSHGSRQVELDYNSAAAFDEPSDSYTRRK